MRRALGPLAAIERCGWLLRSVPGWVRNNSATAPVVRVGVWAGSYAGRLDRIVGWTRAALRADDPISAPTT